MTQEAFRASDVLKSTILASLPSLVAVVSRNGHIIAVNDAWDRFEAKGAAMGDAYLDQWGHLAEEGHAYGHGAP